MSNSTHDLTYKDDKGRTKAHPLYWVWREKRKNYAMCKLWEEHVLEFVEWAEEHKWEKGDNIRRYKTHKKFSPKNCYIHVRGTPLGEAK